MSQALSNYAKRRQNAKTIDFWPLTLRDFAGWFLHDVLRVFCATLCQHGIMWLGESRIGKSAGSKTGAMEQSFFEITGAGRTATVSGHRKTFRLFQKPAIFDDGFLQKQTAEVVKAFLFPSEVDCTIWACYGSATMDQGASRQACNNPINKKALRKAVAKAGSSDCIYHAEFLLVIEPSFTSINDEEDMLAVVARTHIVVCSEEVVLWRTAREEAKPAFFQVLAKGREAGSVQHGMQTSIKAYRDNPNARVFSEDFQWKRVWSQVFLRKSIYGEPLPPILTISGGFNYVRSATDHHLQVPKLAALQDFGQEAAPAIIKKELQIPSWTLVISHGVVIDLDFPSPAERCLLRTTYVEC